MRDLFLSIRGSPGGNSLQQPRRGDIFVVWRSDEFPSSVGATSSHRCRPSGAKPDPCSRKSRTEVCRAGRTALPACPRVHQREHQTVWPNERSFSSAHRLAGRDRQDACPTFYCIVPANSLSENATLAPAESRRSAPVPGRRNVRRSAGMERFRDRGLSHLSAPEDGRTPSPHFQSGSKPERCRWSGGNGRPARSRRQPAAESNARRSFTLQCARRARDCRAGRPTERAGGPFHPELNRIVPAKSSLAVRCYKDSAPTKLAKAVQTSG